MIDPMKALPGYVLRRASAAVQAELHKSLAPLDLRPTEVSILMLIEANPGMTQSEIGRILDIQRANMAPLAARLSDRGLIDRERVDGRSHGLCLTAAGSALVRQARSAIETFEGKLTARVPVELRQHILPLLNALWGIGAETTER